MKFKDPLTKMAVYAIVTSLLGLLAGLILGLLIYWIMTFILISSDAEEFILLAPFFGMAWGSILGAIMGGIVGLKK